MNELNDRPCEEGTAPSDSTPPSTAPVTPVPGAPLPPALTPEPQPEAADRWRESPEAGTDGVPPESPVHGPAATPASSPGKALLIVGLALMVALLGVCGVAAKLWYDQTAAQDALLAAVGALGATVSPDLADTLNPRLAQIRTAASNGEYAEATSRLRHILDGVRPGPLGVGELGGPLDARGAGNAVPGAAPKGEQPPAGGQLPPGVVEFFQKHEKLGALFIRGNELGAKLRDSGGDVTHLREIRNRILEAARLNDEAEVIKLMEQFRDELRKQGAKLEARDGGPRPPAGRRGPGGPVRFGPGAPPAALMTVLRQVDGAMRKAQAEGKDLRRPLEILRDAENLARGRNFSAALKRYKAALEAIRNAPQLPPEPQLFQNPLVVMFLNLLQVEDRELAGTLDNLRRTYASAKADLSRQWSQALQEAVNVLERVGARRHALGQRLEQIRSGKVTSEDLRKAQEAARQKAQEESRAALEAILARVQAMKPEDFAAQRTKLVDEILQAVFAPPSPSGERARPPAAAATSAPPATNAEQRVRQKLLQAAGPFLKVQQDPMQKELADRLSKVFGQARELLAAGKAEEAEKLTDQGLELLMPPVPQTPQTP